MSVSDQEALNEGMAAGRELADTAAAVAKRSTTHDPGVVAEMEVHRRMTDAATGLAAKGLSQEKIGIWLSGVAIGAGLRFKELANG